MRLTGGEGDVTVENEPFHRRTGRNAPHSGRTRTATHSGPGPRGGVLRDSDRDVPVLPPHSAMGNVAFPLTEWNDPLFPSVGDQGTNHAANTISAI
ncbi:hypothetical protein GCM10022232_28040 [Streptomyces plumbiresistens]|uniref:Uncharacterized protein n=1 Tax=Streptomyces plumbiresistens TaxID=511811 RepID=A0ABP7R439_9ACTN